MAGLAIPNKGDAALAGFPNAARLDARDIDTITAGIGGRGVATGCVVTWTSARNISVAAGTIWSQTSGYKGVAVTALAVAAAHATLDRIDIVVVDTSTGVASVTTGVAAAIPLVPAYSSTQVYIARIDVPALSTNVSAAAITDKRMVLAGRFNTLNVREQGAIADNVANDTTVVQNTITLAASIGARVYFPAGTYLLDSLTGTTGLDMFGDGRSVSILKKRTSTGDMLSFTGAETSTIGVIAAGITGDMGVEVVSTSGFAAGDYATVRDSQFWRAGVATKNILTSSAASPTVITTAVSHLLTTNDWVMVTGHTGASQNINGVMYQVTVLTATTFTIPVNLSTGGTGGAIAPTGVKGISGSTNANPSVITTSAVHSLTTGDRVTIQGALDTALNGVWIATVLTTTTFTVGVAGTGTNGAGGAVAFQQGRNQEQNRVTVVSGGGVTTVATTQGSVSTTLVLTDATNFNVGDRFLLTNASGSQREWCDIASKASNTLTLKTATRFAHSSGDVASAKVLALADPLRFNYIGTAAISASTAANPAAITTARPHGYATGDVVTIAGHSVAGLNATWTITVTSPVAFTVAYDNSGGSPGTASGTVVAIGYKQGANITKLTPMHDIRVADLAFQIGGFNGSGISLDYTFEVHLRDLDISGMTSNYGVRVLHSAMGSLTRSRIHDGTKQIGGVSDGTIWLTDATHNWNVFLNEFENCAETPVSWSFDCTFRMNTTRGMIDTAFNTHGGHCVRIAFEYNDIYDSRGSAAISVGFSTHSMGDIDTRIIGNRILNSGNVGISLAAPQGLENYGTIIRDNIILTYGIRSINASNCAINVLFSNATTVERNTIDPRLGDRLRPFASIQQQSYSAIEGIAILNSANCKVRWNEVSGVTSSGTRAIFWTGASTVNITVEFNDVHDCAGNNSDYYSNGTASGRIVVRFNKSDKTPASTAYSRSLSTGEIWELNEWGGVRDPLNTNAVLAPAQIVANTNNYAPTGITSTTVLRINTDAQRNLTGIAAGNVDGQLMWVENNGTFPIVLKHDATSTAANRFYVPNSTDYVLNPNGVVALIYDSTAARWRVIATRDPLTVGSVISPTQIAANTDNYAPAGYDGSGTLRINSDAARNLTGIVALADSRRLLLVNTGAFTITLKHDTTSTAANRFYCPGSADFSLLANGAVDIVYDATSSRWRVIR